VYKYSFRCIQSFHHAGFSQDHSEPRLRRRERRRTPRPKSPPLASRCGGDGLYRQSSFACSGGTRRIGDCRDVLGGSARRLPALTRVWDGSIRRSPRDTLARDADVVFLALPARPHRSWVRGSWDAGVRVIDLSGTVSLAGGRRPGRSGIPEAGRMPDGVHTPHRARAHRGPKPHASSPIRALSTAPFWRSRPRDGGLLLPAADIIVARKSGVSGLKNAVSARIFSSATTVSLPTVCSATGTARKSSRA